MSIILDGTAGATLPTPLTRGNGGSQVSDIPAFSAILSANQSIPNNTVTKLQFSVKQFDTAGAFDNVTNYRFQPLVAGYYQVSLIARDATGLTTGYVSAVLNKNGASLVSALVAAAGFGPTPQVVVLTYMNGTTDYIEGLYTQNSGSTVSVNSAGTYFQACLLRGA